MKIRTIRVEKDLPLPEYQTEGAVAFDFYSRNEVTVPPGGSAYLPTNLIIEVPEGYALIMASRSSLGPKKGLVMRNGIGVVDQDFHGPEDELRMFVHNFTAEPVSIARGERLCQGMIVPIVKAEWEEVEMIKEGSRGGFGGTG